MLLTTPLLAVYGTRVAITYCFVFRQLLAIKSWQNTERYGDVVRLLVITSFVYIRGYATLAAKVEVAATFNWTLCLGSTRGRVLGAGGQISNGKGSQICREQGLSISAASRKFAIPKSTLFNHCTGKVLGR